MAIATAFVILALGLSILYIGWKGISFGEFWQSVQGKGA